MMKHHHFHDLMMLDSWRGVILAAGTAVVYLFGNTRDLMAMLIVLLVIDWLTGVIAAYVANTLSSERGLRGMLRKLMVPVAVVVANFVDQAMGTDGPVLASVVAIVLIANEGLSIIENLADCGVPIPVRLRKALEALRDAEQDKQSDPLPPQ